MADKKTIRANVLRAFTDAGTEKRYEPGPAVRLPAAAFQNYRAAGLVEAATDAPASAAEPAAPSAPDTDA